MPSVQDCTILNISNTVVSIDMHDTWLPGMPVKPVGLSTPHPWLQCLGQSGNPSVSKTTSVNSTNQPIIQRGSDMGIKGIHLGVNILLPLILLSSGSVSEMGSFTVLIENKPVATAYPFKTATLNLNCQGPNVPPCSLPTGYVIAPSVNYVGMQMGDIVGSCVSMLADMALSFVANKAGSAICNKFLGRFVVPYVKRLTPFIAEIPFVHGLVQNIVIRVPGTAIGMFGVGSPVGFSDEKVSLIGRFWGEQSDIRGTSGIKDSGVGFWADMYNPHNGAEM